MANIFSNINSLFQLAGFVFFSVNLETSGSIIVLLLLVWRPSVALDHQACLSLRDIDCTDQLTWVRVKYSIIIVSMEV